MRKLLKNRLALSTVVTTLIILVVSVLLAGVVTYFAINVTSTRVQEESITIQKIHVWCDSKSVTQAAFLLINTGGRDIVINKITVRGQTAVWGNVHYKVESGAVTDDLKYKSAFDGYSAPETSIVFESGKTMSVYITTPDSITVNDIGLTVGVTVFTSQAMYYQEANVQAYVAAAS